MGGSLVKGRGDRRPPPQKKGKGDRVFRSGEDETSIQCFSKFHLVVREYITNGPRQSSRSFALYEGRRVIDQAAILQLIVFHAFHVTEGFLYIKVLAYLSPPPQLPASAHFPSFFSHLQLFSQGGF